LTLEVQNINMEVKSRYIYLPYRGHEQIESVATFVKQLLM